MCTLTFLPTADGYLAGMNRDELRTRPVARPPQVRKSGETETLYPSEPAGGTWIACNQRGVLLALLNWNDLDPGHIRMKAKTRGFVIPTLIGAQNLAAVDSTFERVSLGGVLPFRLFGFFPGETSAALWCWDGTRKDQQALPWSRGHWFSSSLSDQAAEKQRGFACEAAASESGFGTPESLRILHASHIPAAGPFSVCVHRPDAATVSYTEVVCRERSLLMRYVAENPCRKPQPQEISENLLGRDDSSQAA
jgi:hypothetical protein